ncbi:hypothetical protein BCR32DRAFT_328553, partial [Anaeromyces robustus]
MRFLNLILAIVGLAYCVFGKAIVNNKGSTIDVDNLLSTWTVFAKNLGIPIQYVIDDVNMIKNDPSYDISDSLFIKSFISKSSKENVSSKSMKTNMNNSKINTITDHMCCVCFISPCPCQCVDGTNLNDKELKCFKKVYHTTDEEYIKMIIKKMKNSDIYDVLSNKLYIMYLKCLVES